MTIRMSKISPLAIPAGKIRRELADIQTPEAIAFIESVKGLPDHREVVIDLITYNAILLANGETPDEDVQRQPGSDVGTESESGSGPED